MVTTTLSILFCVALLIKLVFFTDEHRQESRLFWRVVLFAVTVYVAKCLLDFLYTPLQPISLQEMLFHGVMLLGSFLLKPSDLPWNSNDSQDKASRRSSSVTYRIR